MALPNISLGGAAKFVIPAVAVVCGVGMVQFYGQLQVTKGQLRRNQQDIARLTSENDTLSQQVSQQRSKFEADRGDLEGRIASLRAQLASATGELERAHVRTEEAEDRYEQLKRESDRWTAAVEGLTAERDDARNRSMRFEQANAELERSVNRLRERITLLDRDYRHAAEQLAKMSAEPSSGLSVVSSIGPATSTDERSPQPPASSFAIPGTVELPPIIVRNDQAMMSLPIRGRLLEVNDPHHFVIVDKGGQDGVRVGMVFDIVRGASSVGRATVVRVRPQLSACDIIRAKTSGSLQAGDLAVQSGS